MATINQIRANRLNAKKSTGPKTPEGKERSRFNALVHGRRAESAILPGEDKAKFNQLLEGLSAAWMPQDEMEKTLVEQIAVNQWKLARLDQAEARIYAPGDESSGEFALAVHRIHLTEARLERCVSSTIADLERYRKERLERQKQLGLDQTDVFRKGLLWGNGKGGRYFEVLPRVCGLDGLWRDIPRELLADPGRHVNPDPSAPA
jgi:hypothetical protein